MKTQTTIMLEKTLERIPPALRLLVQPRRYIQPAGYTNPRINSAALSATLVSAQVLNQLNRVQVDLTLIALKLIDHSCPTIFVGKEFAEALLMTDPPEDMLLSDLQWPFEAVTFVLPDELCIRMFGRFAPFINVTRYSNGMVTNVPPALKLRKPVGVFTPDDGDSCFISTTTLDSGRAFDYASGQSLKFSVKMILSDAGDYKDFASGAAVDYMKPVPFQEDDRMFTKKFVAVAIHLLLALNAVPEQLEAESVIRPERRRGGLVIQDALWHPHILGRNYTHARSEPQGGTHASPRLHPRRGHWRHQRHGKDNALTKVIWIRPMLIGATLEAA